MAHSQKAETRLWVWEGSLAHDVIPLTEGIKHRCSRKIGRNSTIAFVQDPKGGRHDPTFTFCRESMVRRLVSKDPCADLFRFSSGRTGCKEHRVAAGITVDIYVSKSRDKAWIITKP